MISTERKKESRPKEASVFLVGKAFQALPFLSALLGLEWAFCWAAWTSVPSIPHLSFPSLCTYPSLQPCSALVVSSKVVGLASRTPPLAEQWQKHPLEEKHWQESLDYFLRNAWELWCPFCVTNHPAQAAEQGGEGQYLPQSCRLGWGTSSRSRLEWIKEFLCWKWGAKMDLLPWNGFAVLPQGRKSPAGAAGSPWGLAASAMSNPWKICPKDSPSFGVQGGPWHGEKLMRNDLILSGPACLPIVHPSAEHHFCFQECP